LNLDSDPSFPYLIDMECVGHFLADCQRRRQFDLYEPTSGCHAKGML
jgi:hypothetical protein